MPKGPATKPSVRTDAAGSQRAYVVTGVIDSLGDLVLPGARFPLTEVSAVVRWLDELAQKGPAESREKTAALGLTVKQFESFLQGLAPAVGFSTQGMNRAEAVRKIAAKLSVPLELDAQTLAAADDSVSEELSAVSCGSALACLLRPAGLCLVARGDVSKPALAIVPSRQGLEIWPVGWPSQQPATNLFPSLYDMFNANVQGVPVTTVLDAVSQRLKLPILLDHNAMALQGIDPQKTPVNFPQSRTSYSKLLRGVLGQVKLRMELRIDEANRPLLWVTTLLPASPDAAK